MQIKDDLACQCEHPAKWHSNFNQGRCDRCDCPQFVAVHPACIRCGIPLVRAVEQTLCSNCEDSGHPKQLLEIAEVLERLVFQEVEEKLLSGELSETWPEIREWISSKLNAISPRPLRAEVLDALKKMVEFGEEVERQNLVGYEGCFWPVEIARDVIRRASSQVPLSAPPTPWPGSNPNKANPPTSGEIARSAHPNRVSEWISVEERLPEVGQTVLVFGDYWNLEKYPNNSARHFEEDPKKWFDCPGVTHWQPLPAPPSQIEPGSTEEIPLNGARLCAKCGVAESYHSRQEDGHDFTT